MAIPAIAAEQTQTTQKASANTITTASEDDFVLGIYGNANEDDTIDMRDLTYVKLIFFGKKPETELADAKYDGKINPLDFIQIKLITVGKEKELTIVDSADRIVTVKKPIERIVMNSPYILEVMRSIKATDKVVGIDKTIEDDKIFFPEFIGYPSVGMWMSPDLEMMLDLRPDVVFIFAYSHSAVENAQNKLESAGVTVLRFDGYKPEIYVEETKKLGYLLDRKEEADEFLDFYEGFLNTIEEEVEGLSEDRPKVYFECRKYSSAGSAHNFKIAAAGGNNIFGDAPHSVVDPEDVINRDPNIIVRAFYSSVPHEDYQWDADDATELEIVRKEIMSRPELQNVKAVKDGRVFILSMQIYGYMGPGGPRHFVGIGYMAKWFHSKLFEDLDPQAIHQEYLTRFQGLDYDLDKHGVFVYPPFE
jgi:iron complex transport system substrate-binding protein